MVVPVHCGMHKKEYEPQKTAAVLNLRMLFPKNWEFCAMQKIRHQRQSEINHHRKH
jgi:hypothetical protein